MGITSLLKKSPKIYSFLRSVYDAIRQKKIKNYFGTKYGKNALLSYIVYPFTRSQSLAHTNYFEAISHAEALKKLGYNVDVIDYEFTGDVDFSRYEVMIGFGDAFRKYFESGVDNVKTIYYGTGMHVCYANNATLKRVKDVYRKKGKWLCKSSRFVEKTWTHQTALVDGMVVLGNSVSKQSYARFYDGIIHVIPAPIYKVFDAYEILKSRNLEKHKSFLWFGSSGLIHKGLDLVLDLFAKRPDLTLHVCGPIKNEPDFLSVYDKELNGTKNILNHDFVDISSEMFKEILLDCSFVISPSCSEGGAAGTLTAIGNGALIPVITKETTITTGNEIWINELTPDGVEEAVNKAMALSARDIYELQKLNLSHVLKHNSKEVYYCALEKSIASIVA